MNLVLHVCGQFKIKNAKAKKKVHEYKEGGVLYGIKRLYRVRLMHVFCISRPDFNSASSFVCTPSLKSRPNLHYTIRPLNKTVRIILFLSIIRHPFDKIGSFRQIAVCV